MESPIRTKTYLPDREVIFRYFYLRNFARRLLLVGGIYFGMFVVYAGIVGIEKALGLLLILGLVFALFIVAGYALMRRNLSSPSIKIALNVPRYLEFSDRDLYGRMEDGAESRVPWDYYTHAVRKGPETFLYRVGGIVNVPDSAFESADDRAAFQALLQWKGMYDRKKLRIQR